MDDGRERTLPSLRYYLTSRGSGEVHGIPRDSLSPDRDLTSELHENEAGILLIKPTRCIFSQLYFGKEIYMFLTDLLSTIRNLNSVFTSIGICHTGYVDCLLARSGRDYVDCLLAKSGWN